MARLWPVYLKRHGPFLARLVFSNEKACLHHDSFMPQQPFDPSSTVQKLSTAISLSFFFSFFFSNYTPSSFSYIHYSTSSSFTCSCSSSSTSSSHSPRSSLPPLTLPPPHRLLLVLLLPFLSFISSSFSFILPILHLPALPPRFPLPLTPPLPPLPLTLPLSPSLYSTSSSTSSSSNILLHLFTLYLPPPSFSSPYSSSFSTSCSSSYSTSSSSP